MAGLTGTDHSRQVLVSARGLSKVYGSGTQRTTAVEGVDLTVHRGDLYVLMGLSGSGKSTVLRMLNRLVEPTTGTIELDGRDLSRLSVRELREVRNRRISMVFQQFALFPHRTVRENAAYGLLLRGTARPQALARADESLRVVGLGDWGDARPAELSGGMKQRVGLARALSTDADVLLMDEPFSALDPLIRREMQDLLLRLRDELGQTVVFVTHDLNEAMRLGDRITILNRGRVAQTGAAAEILGRPADDYVRRFIGEVDRTKILTARDVMRPAPPGADVHARAGVGPAETLAEIAGRLPADDGGVPVIEAGQVLGYVSSRSVLVAVDRATEVAA
ncbi:betaine/proline/choline family ABC transporter ATP-binding protein [Kocuria himachalensis]